MCRCVGVPGVPGGAWSSPMGLLPPVVCRYGPGVLGVPLWLGHGVPIGGDRGETRRLFDSVSGEA